MRDFTFNGVSLSQFAGRITQAPMHTIASRDKSFVKIYGQSGDELVDNGSYNNVNFSLKIGFLPHVARQTAEQLARAVINWLAPLQSGYYDYTDSYNQGYFTQASLSNFNEIEREMRLYFTATLKFNRVPYWYKISGQTPIEFNNQTLIENPEIYPSEPIVTLRISNISSDVNVNFVVNDKSVQVTMGYTGGNYIQYLDGVAKQHYKLQNNNKIYLSSALPPDLEPGDNIVAVSDSRVTCTIVPNWRRL
jgi:phage-related protein